MIKFFAHEDRFQVWQVKGLLEDFGVPCFIKNEFASGALGDLSPFDCWPEVWLLDEEWQPKAKQLLSEFQQQTQPHSEWFCPNCKVKNEANFEICWQCGHISDS